MTEQEQRRHRIRRANRGEQTPDIPSGPPYLETREVVYYPPPSAPWRELTPPYRLMVIYDVSFDTPSGRIGWAYWRRAMALQKYAPPEWEVDIFPYKDVPWSRCGEYDLVYNLEYCGGHRQGVKGHPPNENVPLVISYNSDGNRRREYWIPALEQADFLIVNNQHAFDHFQHAPRTCCISNGVDTEVFAAKVPIAERPHKCVFAGSTGKRKAKGWDEVLWPLEKIAPEQGFETDFRPVDEISERTVMPTELTVDWYNSASYVLCASLSEGTPNIVTEAVACGCVCVTLPVGNVLEWGIDRENCVLAHERTPAGFLAALEYAREHRERLSAAGMATIRDGWSYGPPGNRIHWYFDTFLRILRDGVDKIEPFSFLEAERAI